LVATHHGSPENVCPFASRCHSKDAAGTWRQNTRITVFSTAKKLIAFDILPRGSTFTQLYFINSIFLNLKAPNLDFLRQKTG
jgi:hypothetical protein